MHINTNDTRKQEQQKKSKQEQYNEAKQLSQEIAQLYLLVGYEKRGRRMAACGKMIMAQKCARCGKVHGAKVEMACYLRLCALCAMRRSRIIAAQGLAALEWIDENVTTEYFPYMLTLTQQNVPDGQLGTEIDTLLEAMAKLRYRRKVQRQLVGYARTIEVTHNHDDKTWHPHVHFIMLLKKDGLPASKLAQQGEWEMLWSEIMSLDYCPEIRIEKLDDKIGAVYEVSKYCAKFKDFTEKISKKYAAQLIKELDNALDSRKLQVWGGAWRKARQALKQKEPETMREDELAEKAKECPECGGAIVNSLMEWSGMEYQVSARQI